MNDEQISSRSRELSRRRQENADAGRPVRHVVRVTEHQEAMLQKRAAEQRVSTVRLMVESALSDNPTETVTERRELVAHLFELQRLLANVANNVNQIAKWANTSGEIAADLHETLEETRAVYERIDDALDYIGKRGGQHR